MRSPLIPFSFVNQPDHTQGVLSKEKWRNFVAGSPALAVLCTALFLASPSRLLAQDPATYSGQLSEFGEIQDFGTDSVDLTNLNVHLDMPLFKKAGRGLDINSHVTHDNVFSSSGGTQFGWETALENLTGLVFYTEQAADRGNPHSCIAFLDWSYRDVYGTLHFFPQAASAPCGTTISGTASDGSGLVLTPGRPWLGTSQAAATITGPDGASWTVASAASTSQSPYIPSGNVVDTNGNTITVATTGVTDTLGDTFTITNYTQPWSSGSTTAPPPETYTYKEANGTPQNVTIDYGFYNLDNQSLPSPCYTNYPGPGYEATGALPQAIKFPDNTQYSFSYESISGTTGRISAVSLPTGGTLSYSYPTPPNISDTNDCVDNGAFILNRTTTNGVWKYTRTLSNYGYSACVEAGNCASYPPPIATTTATAPTGETTVYTFMYFPLNDIYHDYNYLETSKAVYQGAPTGTPLLYQQTCYNGYAPPCSGESFNNLPNASTEIITTTDEYRSYNGAPTSRKTTTYQNPLYLPIEVDEYDFGAATPTRKTYTTYLSVNGVQTNKPLTIVVKDGSNVIWKQTRYGYDETAVVGPSSVPQHSTVTGKRGNLTSTSVWRKSDGVWLESTYINDDTGNKLSSKDQCGNTACSDMTGTNHTTTYVYTDSSATGQGNPAGNSNAYMTQVTYPNTGLAHVENYQYSYASGQRTQMSDANGVVTKYSYNDAVNRLTLVDNAVSALNAGGGSAERKSTYSYPSATLTSVAQDQTATGDGALKSSMAYDGLGRAIKTVNLDGSVVETAYDDYNRKCAVSNPTFTDPGPLSCTASKNKAGTGTDGITYFTYDALGRKSVLTQPDNNTRRWTYTGKATGNVVDFYDEDKSHWQSTTDGLGRLTKVLENDPGGSGQLTLETDYVYDPLNELVSVNQKGASGDTPRIRTFAYDSLSHLTNACNPEAIAAGSTCTASGPWSAAYVYDANGNVSTRTDARGVVTHYTYDDLNRVTAKSYTNDPANTPAMSFGYDQEFPWQLVSNENNGIGHLNWIEATLGTTSLVTWTSNDYDQRGNLLGYADCLGSNAQSCPGTGAGASYDFNLDSTIADFGEDISGASPTSQTQLVYNTYDTAGRLNSISTSVYLDNSSNNSVVSTAFSSPKYYPAGLVESASLNLNAQTQAPGIALSRTYDNRRRLTGEIDTTATQKTYKYSVNYDANSNVTGYNDTVEGVWTATDDSLHRLSHLSGTLSGVGYTIQETYDHFGNRNVETVTSGTNQTQPSPYLNFTAGNNRVTNWSYDNAGNLLSDGTNNYLYDAENRLCATEQAATAGDLIGYLYAPDGPRLGKGKLSSFSCDLTKNGMLTANGLALTNIYAVGPKGEQLHETDGNLNFIHFNVFWQGNLLGTYTGNTYAQSNWQFAVHDWIGTKRSTTNLDGTHYTSTTSSPFGDYQNLSGSVPDPSEQHFTGKERDVESNLDYFPARYYNSNLGRYMSPDWSKNPQGVPYADFSNPQSLNLYSYAGNNPLVHIDKDGHCWSVFQGACDLFKSVVNEFRFGTFTPDSKMAEIRSLDRQEIHDRQAVSAALAGGARRLSSAQLRAIWEKANPGQKVPFDEVRGRYFDMNHIKALADGGTNDAENLEPLEHGEHMARHANDFVRWGSRASDAAKEMTEAVKSGAEDTGQAIGDAAEELVNNPGEALQDAATAALEAVESGELPPP